MPSGVSSVPSVNLSRQHVSADSERSTTKGATCSGDGIGNDVQCNAYYSGAVLNFGSVTVIYAGEDVNNGVVAGGDAAVGSNNPSTTNVKAGGGIFGGGGEVKFTPAPGNDFGDAEYKMP